MRPPRWACQATPGIRDNTMKPPIIAIQRDIGTGIGNMKTLSLGVRMVNTPPRAKTAPEAPTAGMGLGLAKRRKKMLATMPPQK